MLVQLKKGLAIFVLMTVIGVPASAEGEITINVINKTDKTWNRRDKVSYNAYTQRKLPAKQISPHGTTVAQFQPESLAGDGSFTYYQNKHHQVKEDLCFGWGCSPRDWGKKTKRWATSTCNIRFETKRRSAYGTTVTFKSRTQRVSYKTPKICDVQQVNNTTFTVFLY